MKKKPGIRPGIRHGIRSVLADFRRHPRLAAAYVALLASAVAGTAAGVVSVYALFAVISTFGGCVLFHAYGYDRYHD